MWLAVSVTDGLPIWVKYFGDNDDDSALAVDLVASAVVVVGFFQVHTLLYAMEVTNNSHLTHYCLAYTCHGGTPQCREGYRLATWRTKNSLSQAWAAAMPLLWPLICEVLLPCARSSAAEHCCYVIHVTPVWTATNQMEARIGRGRCWLV